MPDLLNPKTQEVLGQRGDFDYDKFAVQKYDYEISKPLKMDNETVYVGQLKNGQKCGRGKLMWPDGSVYEGQWENDMSNGKGRLIHADGDVYEGDWVDNKAEG